MNKQAWQQALNIPEVQPLKPNDFDLVTLFTKKSNFAVCYHYSRVVIGDRGPYIEIPANRLVSMCLTIPEDQKWRREDPVWKDRVYYEEWRTVEDNVMVYFQKKTVKYADYKVGFFYVSPWDLTSPQYGNLIQGKKPKTHK